MQAQVDYIHNLVNQSWISVETSKKAVILLQILSHLGAYLPSIAPGPDGMVGFTWDERNSTGYYTTVEISSDGRIEFFQEHIASGQMDSVDF